MNQELFENRYAEEWARFQDTLDTMSSSRSLPTERIDDFPHAYRRLCKQLALARERRYSARLVANLDSMVLRAHQILYRSRGGALRSLAFFFAVTFPRAVRAEYKLFWLSALLFYGSTLAVYFGVRYDSQLVYSLLPPSQVVQFEEMYDPANREERAAASDILMFGFYIRNNTGIGFRTFAAGFFAGVGSMFFLLLNGIFFGAVAGHLSNVGFDQMLFTFVIAHGAFELTAIVLGGLAGMKLGFVLIRPGNRSRRQALLDAGKTALPIVYGMATLFILAAFVEAFWSPRVLPYEIKYAVGAVFWFVTGLYFLFAGRSA